MKRILCAAALVVGLALPAAASADAIYGKCIGKGGNKCETHNRISTSWNSRTGKINRYRGTYRLDFGGKVNAYVTVYCNGRSVGRVRVKGNTYFTVHCR